jgi:hypothetical protein
MAIKFEDAAIICPQIGFQKSGCPNLLPKWATWLILTHVTGPAGPCGRIFVLNLKSRKVWGITPRDTTIWRKTNSGPPGPSIGPVRTCPLTDVTVPVGPSGRIFVLNFKSRKVRGIIPRKTTIWRKTKILGPGALDGPSGHALAIEYSYWI